MSDTCINGAQKTKKEDSYLVNANGVEAEILHERKVALAVGGFGEGVREAGSKGPGLVSDSLDEKLVLCNGIEKLCSFD